MAQPEMIVTSTPYPAASRAEEILQHPALLALRDQSAGARVSDADWVCGTPHLIRAIRQMQSARAEMGE
jgi:iron complex transport system substrate-binding protein